MMDNIKIIVEILVLILLIFTYWRNNRHFRIQNKIKNFEFIYDRLNNDIKKFVESRDIYYNELKARLDWMVNGHSVSINEFVKRIQNELTTGGPLHLKELNSFMKIYDSLKITAKEINKTDKHSTYLDILETNIFLKHFINICSLTINTSKNKESNILRSPPVQQGKCMTFTKS